MWGSGEHTGHTPKTGKADRKNGGKKKDSWGEKKSYHTAPDGLQEGI